MERASLEKKRMLGSVRKIGALEKKNKSVQKTVVKIDEIYF